MAGNLVWKISSLLCAFPLILTVAKTIRCCLFVWVFSALLLLRLLKSKSVILTLYWKVLHYQAGDHHGPRFPDGLPLPPPQQLQEPQLQGLCARRWLFPGQSEPPLHPHGNYRNISKRRRNFHSRVLILPGKFNYFEKMTITAFFIRCKPWKEQTCKGTASVVMMIRITYTTGVHFFNIHKSCYPRCVKQSLANQIGCRVPWEPNWHLQNENFPNCTTLDQYK